MKKHMLIVILTISGCVSYHPIQEKQPIGGDIVEHVLNSIPIFYSNGWYCTSVAIDKYLAVTAKHCTDDSVNNKIVLTTYDNIPHTVTTVNPDNLYDISLVSVDIPFSDWVPVNNFIATEFPYAGEPVITYGYGCPLLEGRTRLEEHADSILGVSTNQIFLKGLACKGDSGGPVMRSDGTVIGIVITTGPDKYQVGATPIWVDESIVSQ